MSILTNKDCNFVNISLTLLFLSDALLLVLVVCIPRHTLKFASIALPWQLIQFLSTLEQLFPFWIVVVTFRAVMDIVSFVLGHTAKLKLILLGHHDFGSIAIPGDIRHRGKILYLL